MSSKIANRQVTATTATVATAPHQEYNFSAGPAILPAEVHQQLAEALAEPRGIPLLELGHRTKEFDEITAESTQSLRDLLNIPEDYAVLFMPGGARSQYAAISLNLNPEAEAVDYLDTGFWSKCAIAEAEQYAPVSVVECLESGEPYRLKPTGSWQMNPQSIYCHYVSNETLTGVEFAPSSGGRGHLVSDMTSNLLTRPENIKDHCLIYAAAQKNAGIAGVTIVIVANDRLGKARSITPSIYNYQRQVQGGSRYGTPATLSWYVAHLMLRWIKKEGGLEVMNERALARSSLLYDCIDRSDLYESVVDPACRSRLNVCFYIDPLDLQDRFLTLAQENGLLGLRGHGATGGVRASLYNGMPLAGAEALATFMKEFERTA